MGDILGKVGGFFKSAAPAIEGVTAGAGLFGNLMNMIQRGKVTDQLKSAEQKYADLTPEQLAGLVSRAQQPLGQDLLQNVGNLVQADMATRGLAQAPGIFAATETQALAPYKLQQQQMALQLIMKQMGLPIEYAQALLQAMGGNTDVTPILKLLQGGGGGETPNQVPDTSGIPSDTGKILEQIIAQQSGTPGLTTPNAPSSDTGVWD
jgi:hypothetical protein